MYNCIPYNIYYIYNCISPYIQGGVLIFPLCFFSPFACSVASVMRSYCPENVVTLGLIRMSVWCWMICFVGWWTEPIGLWLVSMCLYIHVQIDPWAYRWWWSMSPDAGWLLNPVILCSILNASVLVNDGDTHILVHYNIISLPSDSL